MKALLLCGSPHAHGCTYTALCEAEKSLRERGVETEIFQLGTSPVQGCIGCGKCASLGRCVFDDAVNALAARLDEFDALIVGSPVYYAAPNGALLAFLDRLFYSAGAKMRGKVAAAVVSCRRGGASAAFDVLNKFFGMNNMVVATSQYWNQVHGAKPEDVLCDEEGLQTMRTLGQNVAWLLQMKENRPLPTYEPKIRTNFIR